MKFDNKIVEGRYLVPQKHAAAIMGISIQSLQRWPVEPVDRAGRIAWYDIGQLINHRIARDEAGDEELDLTKERARLAKEQADKTSLENKISRAELVKLPEVVREMGRMVAACKARLLSIPTALSTYLVNVEDASSVESQLKVAITEALKELTDYQPSRGADSGDLEAVEAPAKPNGKRVGGRGKKAKPRGKRAAGAVAN